MSAITSHQSPPAILSRCHTEQNRTEHTLHFFILLLNVTHRPRLPLITQSCSTRSSTCNPLLHSTVDHFASRFDFIMPRSYSSRKSHSSSFTSFVARLQRTFSIKTSTPLVQQHQPHRTGSISRDPHHLRCRLSQILYDPARQLDYRSDRGDNTTTSDRSHPSEAGDESDSCYDSMSGHHPRSHGWNLSQMNVSMDWVPDRHSQPRTLVKLPNSLHSARFHSTAIEDVSQC
jgi:hypothetical protein